MDTHPQIYPASTPRFLICLGLAIDETKLIKSINRSTAMIKRLETVNPSSLRLDLLKKEILNLETKLAKTRSKFSRVKTVTKLPKFK